MSLKRFSALLLSLLMLLTCLTGCNKGPTVINPNGEIEDSEEEPVQIDPEQQMPVYDPNNLPQSNERSNEEYISYYARQLNDRNKICYDEIYNAANTFQDEVVLSKSISPEALKQIMHIIYLDTPELYMLETDYAYDTDSNGNIYKVYLKYVMTFDQYTEVQTIVLNNIVSNLSLFKSVETEYESEMQIIQVIESRQYTNYIGELEFFSGKNPESSFYAIARNFTGNHLAYAKLFSYYCRRSGLDATIVIGELTNTDYAKEIGIDLKPYVGPAGAISETINGTHVSVSIDYSSFYAWNIVKLNNEWYHVDLLFPKQWKNAYGSEYQNLEMEDVRTTLNVDDYTISQSRLFYINEDLLGLIPECNSKIFQSIYRNGNYFLNYNEGQMVIAITQKLDDLVTERKNIIMYQFGSEETYEIFMRKFDQVLESYNENNGGVIENYRIIENKETLSLVITDLIYM